MNPALAMLMAQGGGGGGTYLDSLATLPKAAFAIKKLISTATVAIRIRRSNDNAEQDIGFSGDALDTSALASFVGSNSAYITKVYDQTGNGFDAVQATFANQPRIVNAGVYDGKIVFDGGNDFLKITSLTLGVAQVGIYWRLAMPTSGTKVMLESSANYNSNSNAFILYFDSSEGGYNAGMGVSGAQRRNSFTVPGGMNQVTTLFDKSLTGADEIKAWANGSSLTPDGRLAFEQTGTLATNDIFIGARSGAGIPADMSLDTLVIYAGDTSVIRASIEALI